MRRRLACALLVLAAAAALAAPPRLDDGWWGVTLDLPGATVLAPVAPPEQIVRAQCDADGTDIDVEVTVVETRAASAAEVLDRAMGRWTERGRPMGGVARDDDAGLLLLTDRGIGNVPLRHAYRYVVRGDQTFVAHARAPGGTDDAELRRAVETLRVDSDAPGCLAALAIASDMNADRTSTRVALLAAGWYAEDDLDLPQLAARQAERALAATSDATDDERWALPMKVGLAYLRHQETDDSLDWLRRALDAAPRADEPDLSAGLTLYNIACAQAAAGDADDAFATLRTLVDSGGWPNHMRWAQEDPDLESLRADPRWADLPEPQ